MSEFLANKQKKNDFVKWAYLKEKIHFLKDENILYCKERDIWWASLGINIGREEDGKNANFERPVLILRKVNRYTMIIVPFSGNIKNDLWRHKIIFNHKPMSVLIFQIRLISNKRLIRKIGILDVAIFKQIKDRIRSIL